MCRYHWFIQYICQVGTIIFNILEYKVGFFDLNGMPKLELELLDSQGVKCIWGGVRRPRSEIKILHAVDNVHLLLSIFVSLYIPFAFYRYP